MSKGYVYIISNPCIRYEYTDGKAKKTVCPVKIGIAKDVEHRLGTLNTSLPENFVHHMSVRADDPKAVENVLHEYLREYRILTKDGERTEFFKCTVEHAISEFRKVAKHMHLKEYHIRKTALKGRSASKIKTNLKSKAMIVQDADKKQKVAKRYMPAKAFTFSAANVPLGAKVVFIYGGQLAKVVDDKHVEYKGNIYSLSGLTKLLLPDNKRTQSDTYQGPAFFTYDGQKLTARISKSL